MLNQTPPVVKNLLIINALFLLGQWALQSQGLELSSYLGMHHWSSEKFMPHQLITHMFMHANITHLFFNMFALWMFGRILEPHWGAKKFLFYYLFTGVGASVLHVLVSTIDINTVQAQVEMYQNSANPEDFFTLMQKYVMYFNPDQIAELNQLLKNFEANPTNPEYIRESMIWSDEVVRGLRDIDMVGASGAVYGILLAFGMTFPNVMLFLLFPPIPIKAKWMVIAYGALELWLGISNNPGDNVAHFAHLGGMLFGIILILYWKKKNPNPPTYFH